MKKGRNLGVDDRADVGFETHFVDELTNAEIQDRGVKSSDHLDGNISRGSTTVFGPDLFDHLVEYPAHAAF